MDCHVDPSKVTCPLKCETKLNCGHNCLKSCHNSDNSEHLCIEKLTAVKNDKKKRKVYEKETKKTQKKIIEVIWINYCYNFF